MGRTQVSQSLRSQVHSAPTNPKLQQKQQQQKQQQQHLRPTSAHKAHPNAQVYRPTPVTEHPDDAFLTGAWMFDQSRIPQWMHSQLPATHNSNTKSAKMPAQKRPTTTSTVSPKHMQSTPTAQTKPSMSNKTPPAKSTVQQQLKQSSTLASKHKVIRPTPVYEHPDTAFLSGAWLFDAARTPLWMQREVPTLATALVVRSRRLSKPLPFARTQKRFPESLEARRAAMPIPLRQSFGATPYAVIRLGSVRARNAHPDDAFYSGAWIFDSKCAPSWLAQELRGGKHPQAQSVHVQKQRMSHTQYAGVKLANGRKLAGV